LGSDGRGFMPMRRIYVGLPVTIRSVRANSPSLLFQLMLAYSLRISERDMNVIEQFPNEEKLFWREE
jgi:hypothetical protein